MPDNEMDKTSKLPIGSPVPQAPKTSTPLNVPGSKPNPIPLHERTSQVPIMDRTQQVTPIDPKTGKPIGQPAAPYPTAGIVKPNAAGSAFAAPAPAQPAAPAQPKPPLSITPTQSPGNIAQTKPAAQTPAPAAPKSATPEVAAADKTVVLSKPPAIAPVQPKPVSLSPTQSAAPAATPPVTPTLSKPAATPTADADKTVVLSRPPTVSPIQPNLVSPTQAQSSAQSAVSAAAQPSTSATPSSDKTVVLSRPPSASPTPVSTPVPMSPPPPPLPSTTPFGIDIPGFSESTPSGSKNTAKVMSVAFVTAVVLVASGWLVVPKFLKNSADQLAKQGRHADAAKKLQLASSLFPLNRIDLLIQLGQQLRISKDYANAEKALSQVLKTDPNEVLALKEMGIVQSESGQKAVAITTFQKYLDIKQDDTEVMKWIADIAYDQKNYVAASKAFDKYVKVADASADDWKKLGISYYEQNLYDQSADPLKKALDKNKDLKDVHGLLGKINVFQQKYGDAMMEFKSELALSPERADLKDDYALAAQKSADLFLSEGKYSEAVGALLQGLSVSTKSDAFFHYQLANLYAVRKKRSDAFNHLAQTFKADPTFKTKAKKDSAFAQYRNLPAFKKLVR